MSKKKAEEELQSLLESWIEDFDPDMTFRQLAAACSDLPFWVHLDLETAEDIFVDFVEEFEHKQMYRVKERYFELKRECFKFLENSIPSAFDIRKIVWTDVKSMLDGNEAFSSLDDLDKFEIFEDFVRDIISRMREDRRRAEKRVNRKRREQFVALLESRKDEILTGVKWHDFVDGIKAGREYVDLIGTRNSSQPYDLFAELRSRWKRTGEDRSRSNSPDGRKRKNSLSGDESDSKRAR